MPINAQNRSLRDWFTRIRTRQIVLPRFQRFETWNHTTITQMFNTILRELPVGATLVLEIGEEEPFISRPISGAPKTGERVTEHLLDGQQRLTGLWRGLHNNYENRTYFLCLNPEETSSEETEKPYYVRSIARWKQSNDMERRPFWANKPSGQWQRKLIPLDIVNPDNASSQKIRNWAKEAIEDRDERDTIIDRINEILMIFLTFNLPFLSLPVVTPRDTALDVFIKMNTSAAQLSIYDIVVAQVEAGMNKSLHDLVADARKNCPMINEYYNLENLVLYANALLQTHSPTYSTFMKKDFGELLIANWEKLIRGMDRTVDFLESERIFDYQRIPTDVVIPVLVALWSIAPESLDIEGRVRSVLQKYLWRAFITNRYERSTSSRSLTDFKELKPLVTESGNSDPVIFDISEYPLPSTQELITAGWPKRKDRLARAILALALRKGGYDLADNSEINRKNLSKREYHHIFPVAHLVKNGYTEDQIHRSLNCALVSWQTNRNISNKKPERYLTERCEGAHLGKYEVKERLVSHIIPYEDMVRNDYENFLKSRARLIERSMQNLCDVKQII